MPKKSISSLPAPSLESRIHTIRGHKVMLDSDLGTLYGVTTKRLNEVVKRNFNRFPANFMFRLTDEEAESLRSQIATSNRGRGGRRYDPYVFTEHGVVMLSAVLSSPSAVEVSIRVVESFIRMRELTAGTKDILIRVQKLERGHDRAASVIEILVDDIDRIAEDLKRMQTLPASTKRKIGFDL